MIAIAIPASNEWKTSSRITAHAVKYFARVFSFCGERLRRDWREDQSHHTYMRSPLTRHIRWMILSLVGPPAALPVYMPQIPTWEPHIDPSKSRMPLRDPRWRNRQRWSIHAGRLQEYICGAKFAQCSLDKALTSAVLARCWADVGITQQTGGVEPMLLLMLGHRRRRWTNIKTRLAQCLVFAGIQSVDKKNGAFSSD